MAPSDPGLSSILEELERHHAARRRHAAAEGIELPPACWLPTYGQYAPVVLVRLRELLDRTGRWLRSVELDLEHGDGERRI